MADDAVLREAGGDVTLPEFTAASSEHSDGGMDELQFGNVDMSLAAGAAQSVDTRAAIAVNILTCDLCASNLTHAYLCI